MAYPISQEALDLFTHPYRQIVDISFYGLSEELHLTEEDIKQGGLSINRYCVSGNRIEIGSAVAAEIELKLDNADGRFNDVQFEGAEMYVRIGTKKWDAHRWENAETHFVPFGYFTVDEAPRKLEVITLAALDRMVQFDKTVDMSLLSFPMTAATLLSRICDICNVTLGTDPTTLPNYDYVINEAPVTEELLYRQLLSWIAELTGTCAFIDWDGHLILKWYTETDVEIDLTNRFKSDLEENAVEITGVQVVTEEETFLVGDDGYCFNIEGNELVQHDFRTVAENLYTVLGGFTYTPFSATVKPMPHLYPLDMITFLDKTGGEHTSIITDITFDLNKGTAIEGKGETATKNGYATANPLTKKESAIIAALQQLQNETLNDRVQTVLAFNELICNAMGLYETPVTQPDGSVIYYLHNKPNLEESETIFTMTAQGIAWTTTGWNGGSPVWAYGVTAAGDALFRLLSAEGIEVSKVGEDYNIEITPSAFRIYYRDMLVTNIEADEMNIPKAFFTTYAQCGRVRLIPYKQNNVEVGTNLVFLD